MRIAFILNPNSGGNRRRPWLEEAIHQAIRDRQLDGALHLTRAPGHATELAAASAAAGCERVIAIGGDGTMNEVASALLDRPTLLGLIPGGSGNGLGRHLGLPREFHAALKLVTEPDAYHQILDTGSVNGRAFCNVMGLGFDAEVGARFNQLETRGLAAYVRVTLGSLRDLQPVRCRISVDHRPVAEDALLVAVANSSQYGNHALIAPPAQVDDGQLDLVVVKPSGLLAATTLIPSLFLGNLHRRSRVIHRQGRSFTIERAQSGLVHVDGETFHTDARVDVSIRPGSLRLIVPRSYSTSEQSAS
jgi:diacylglycerol kinase (ATP)